MDCICPKSWNCPFSVRMLLKSTCTVSPEISHRYGGAAYEVFYYAARQVMRAGCPLILESNFTPQSADVLKPIIESFGYEGFTFLFDANLKCCTGGSWSVNVDTTDFGRVDYEALDRLAKEFLQSGA